MPGTTGPSGQQPTGEQQALFSRRRVLAAGAGTALLGALSAACSDPAAPRGPQRIGPAGPLVARAEQRRKQAHAQVVSARLDAQESRVDLGGGRAVTTWTYGGGVPGPLLRGKVGDELHVRLANRLPTLTSVHWHGMEIRNDMDGVPYLTQPPVAHGAGYDYRFTLPRPGTYWYHAHMGVQRDRGLYGPLIVDDPRDRGDYDVEFTVMIDDWIDGVDITPDKLLGELKAHGPDWHYRVPVQAGAVTGGIAAPSKPPPMTNAQGQMLMSVPVGPGGTIAYPLHLVNGKLPTAPTTFTGRPGQRAKIRIINASACTIYRVALGGHRLIVTEADAYPVSPATVDALDIASGERYDVVTTLADGVFPLVAVAEGKRAQALAVVRTGSGRPPPADVQPAQLGGRVLQLADLVAAEGARLPDARPDVQHDLWLTGDMTTYSWHIDGHAYVMKHPFQGLRPVQVRPHDRVRLRMQNTTPMFHPIHVHGHTFQVRSIGRIRGAADTPLPHGPRKDTVLVGPGQRITVDLLANNPGQWLTHCHNAYHLATGMATVLSYVR